MIIIGHGIHSGTDVHTDVCTQTLEHTCMIVCNVVLNHDSYLFNGSLDYSPKAAISMNMLKKNILKVKQAYIYIISFIFVILTIYSCSYSVIYLCSISVLFVYSYFLLRFSYSYLLFYFFLHFHALIDLFMHTVILLSLFFLLSSFIIILIVCVFVHSSQNPTRVITKKRPILRQEIEMNCCSLDRLLDYQPRMQAFV